MQNTFRETRRQIRDIRNFLAPFDLELASLDERVAGLRVSLGEVRSKLSEASSRLDDQRLRIAYSLARVELIETMLRTPPGPARKSAWPPRRFAAIG